MGQRIDNIKHVILGRGDTEKNPIIILALAAMMWVLDLSLGFDGFKLDSIKENGFKLFLAAPVEVLLVLFIAVTVETYVLNNVDVYRTIIRQSFL